VKALVAFMHELADAAGRVAMPFYRTLLTVEGKGAGGPFDPVTAADRGAEEAMRTLIRRHHPAYGIIGEEFGAERTDAEFVWVLDPIDGTRAFLSGIPTWGILIGLLRHGEPALGLIDQPYLRERFWGDGAAAHAAGFRGARVLRTRRGVKLADAIVWASSTFTADPAVQAKVEALRPHVRMLRYGSDCFNMAMLAEGHIDVVLETGLEIYDVCAMIPVVLGAGGAISGLAGGPALRAGTIIAAGDAALRENVLQVLSQG
jgi:myo-inositol-1(or 4)-monophosphatase